jgi:hypothetical protein
MSRSFKPGHRLYIDISGTIWRSFWGAKVWILIVDDYSRYCWSYFIPDKSGLKHIILIFFRLLEVTYNIRVGKIRLDNSGENIDMADANKVEGYNVAFEFVNPGSPQCNGVVERMFATLFGMVRSMPNEARVPMNLCRGLWAEAARNATDMRNYLVSSKSETSSYGSINTDHTNHTVWIMTSYYFLYDIIQIIH